MLEEYLIRSRTRDGLFVVAMTAIFFDTNKLFRAGKKKTCSAQGNQKRDLPTTWPAKGCAAGGRIKKGPRKHRSPFQSFLRAKLSGNIEQKLDRRSIRDEKTYLS